jgi:hypothetical protein
LTIRRQSIDMHDLGRLNTNQLKALEDDDGTILVVRSHRRPMAAVLSYDLYIRWIRALSEADSMIKKTFVVLLLLAGSCLGQLQGQPQPTTGNLTAASASCLASNCLSIPVFSDTSTVTFQLSGTWSATVQFEFSVDNGVTWTALAVGPMPSGQQVTSATANGVWQADAAGFTNVRTRVSAFSSGTVVSQVSLAYGINGQTPGPVDPCASAAIDKSSFSVAISTATTTAVQAGVAGKRVYVCAFTIIYTSGTTPTVQFEVGTGGTCGTGTTAKTGVMAIVATSGQGLIVGAGHTLFSGTAGQDVCILSAGTTPTVNGWVTYVLM